ncbi:3-epi-6-deoxocathasterone 23-monooxygenase [Abeliophyllum distichum]|uniref:3-epi-6-deoxocathasterone 23-monooxygenase n=1 Tax=Abeliophyllum distichum TaxID=126358 RepID=A0ABD1SD44_9LAMI
MAELNCSESWVLIGIVLVLSSVVWLLKKKGEEKKNGVPRGSSGWPFIGETLEFIACGYTSKPVTFMEKRKSLYGNVFKTHILGKAIIVSTDPDVNKAVLQNHGNVFIPCYPKSICELLGKSSILQMNGYVHKRVHALIGVFLKSPQLKDRITRDIEKTVRFSLSTWMDKSRHVYLQDETKKITFEILVRVLLSIGPGEDMDFLKREFEEFIKGLICLPIKLPGTRLYKSLQSKEKLLKMVSRIVEDRKMAMEKTEDKGFPNDVIDVLLRDAGESDGTHCLPLDFISGNIIEMMIPGEETVPTAMTVAVKFLTDNPTCPSPIGGGEHGTKETEGLFLQRICLDGLYVLAIHSKLWRKALKDVKIKDYLIPEGWCLLASFSSVHMDDINYENPCEFDPWRWDKTGAAVSSNTFTPFGGGQRLCPGLELSRLEISIFLHHLVTTCRWVAEKDEIVYFPTVRMKRKLPIIITPLQQ